MKSLRHPATFASLLLALVIASPAQAQSPIISATKSDGTPAATRKAPGSTVTYTNVISNTGAGNATGVTFTDPDVAGAVVTPGTLKVSPIAFDDAYTGTVASGVTINTATSTGFSVTANDFVGIHNGAAGVLTITAFDATSTNGGTVTMTTSGPDIGKFTYTSAGGFSGPDSFNYTISNSSFTNTGTVRLTVSGGGVVFVNDATGDDTTGKGTLNAPYKTLTKAATVDSSADRIFLFSGNYTAGLTMEADEQLIGQGIITGTFDTQVLGFVPGLDSIARPSLAGTKPIIAVSAGNAITLADNNVIRGVAITSTAPAFAIAGTGINTFQFGSTAAGAGGDTTVTSNNAAGGCISLNGGNGTVVVTGQLTATLGRSLSISGRTGGTSSFIGKIVDNNQGIDLINNTGTSFNFRSLNLATGANTSFAANNGGIIALTGGENDLIDNDGDGSTDEIDEANTVNNTTGGTCVRLNGVSMGAAGVTFRSITSTGGTSPGIIMLGAGSSGFFSVTGDGGGSNNDSGGSITGKTGSTLTTGTPGVYVSGGPNVRLNYMNLSSNNYAGVYGNLVNGFVLQRCNITNNGDTFNTNEGGVELIDLAGTAAVGAFPTVITQCSITNNKNFELLVSNTTGTLAELQLATTTFSTNTLSVTEPHNHLVSVVGSGTAVMTAKVASCTFTGTAVTGNGTSGTGFNADTGGGSLTVEVSGSSFTNNNVAATVSHFAGGNLTFDIHDNITVHTNRSHGLNYFANVNTTGTANGKFRNNVVGQLGTAGSASEVGFGIRVQNESNHLGADCNILVTGNLLQEGTFSLLNINQGVAAQASSRATNVTISSNTFRNVPAARGIQLFQNNTTAPGITRASISGNTFSNIAGQAGDGTEIRLRHLAGGTFNVQQADHATLASSNSLTTADVLLAGTITFNAGAPPAPPLLFAPGGVDKVVNTAPLAVVAPAPASSVESALPVAAVPAAPAAAAAVAPAAGLLTQAQLSATVAAAMDRWQASGLSAEQTALLRSLTFEVADLPDLRLGEADGRIIRVDTNAGGTGWYINGSAGSDAEFPTASSATRLYTQPTGVPAGRLDLLTALMHEMGHALGLEDSYLAQDRESLMYGFLTMGERRLPAKGQAVGVTPHEHGGSHFLSAPVVIGVLPPGKSVTISYDVTINDPVTVSPLSSQGTVSGGNFANVLTDDLVTGGDPLLPGAADPTVTLISQPEVTVVVTGSPVAEGSGSPMTYTFTRTGATTAAMQVNFRVTGTASTIGDYSMGTQPGVSSSFATGSGLGFIVIPAGSASAFMTVTPTSDSTVEPDETAILTVDTGSGYDPGVPAAATGTITNDDAGISINTLPDASLFEDQSLNFAYTFVRTGVTTGTTTVNFSVGGTATFATDYTQSGAASFTTTTGTVVFNPGETTKVVTLDPTNDNVVEGNETIILTVTSGTGYSPVPATAQTATIIDDDVNVSVSGPVPATSVEDSGTGMDYTFTRSGGSVSNALTVNIGVSGTAVFNVIPANSDYAQSGAASFTATTGTITFAGGVTTKTVTITPIADVTNEPDETVILTVAANGTPAVTGGYSVGGTPSGTGTILNDDTQVSVAVAPTPVGEASSTGMVYTFTRTGSTAAAQLVNFTKSGTASIATSDFSTASSDGGMNFAAGTVTIPIGSSSATITLTPLEDALVEGSETAILTVAAGSGYGVSGSPATGTITDNDTATIGYVSTTSTVGEATANDVQQLVLTITATGAGTPALAYPVTVNVTGPSGTATSGTDYTPPTGVTFAATSLNATQVAASIAITNDRAVEGNETAGLGLAINTDGTSGAVTIAVGAAATHTTTITDNDTATVSYSAANSSVGEGAGNDSIGLTLTVTGNGTGPLVLERSASFNITATGGTATGSGTDYTLPVAVSIPATTLDAAVTNFNLAIANDQLVEGSETAILGLTLNTDNTGGQVAVGPGIAHTTTITDNDTATITFAAPTSNVAENAGPDVMNLVLTIVGNGVGTAQITSAVSVNVTNAGGGTATGAGVDYTLPALVTFPANSLSASTQPASLGITDEAIVETSETVNLGLAINSDPSGSVTIGVANAHTTTILDNDTATVSFAKLIDGSEGPPIVNGKFRITQTAQSSTNTVVNYTVSGSAVPGPGNDYATLSGTATILAGNTSVDVDVIVQADVGSEPTETVIITFSSFGLHDADITLGAPSSATLNILSGAVPVSSALGDAVTDNGAPSTDGATNIGKYDLLRRSGALAENGDLVFSGNLLVTAGPPVVTLNDFQGIWAKDAANPLRLIARSGSVAAGTGNALFDILPEVPAINDVGDVTFLASLRIGSGSPAVTASNDTGIWTTMSVAGANPQPVLAIREGSALAPPTSAVITKFATGVYATANPLGNGVIVFSGTEADGKTGVYVMTMAGGLPSAAVTTAKQGVAAPGAGGEVYDHLASGFTDPARMDSAGNYCYSAKLKPSGREGIWYAPIATGLAAKVVIMGDAAPGTTTTFSRLLDLPVMGGVNNIAFHAYVAATGDNAANDKADGIWKGVAPLPLSTYTLALRCGDTVAGLPGGAKVGNMWSPWMSNGNHLALRAWVDIDGNGVSGSGTDVTGLFTDTNNTMTLVVKQGDVAPGMGGVATFNFMDLPVIGGQEQMAFFGTVTGGGTTAANNQGIWRQAANGGALSLIARTGDTVSTTQGTKTISKIDFPGTSQPAFTTDHRWEQRVMDGTGRMILQFTFTDGTTSQVLTP